MLKCKNCQVEAAPADKEAREDFNKFVREILDQNTNNGGRHGAEFYQNIFTSYLSGIYDRRFLTGVTIEARIPQMPLFQGRKIPKFSSENRNEKISLPLSHNSMKISVGDLSFELYNDNNRLFIRESLCGFISTRTMSFHEVCSPRSSVSKVSSSSLFSSFPFSELVCLLYLPTSLR